ncbi:MAG: FAS1-like dehydratase domain-containing protein, partial [Acidimicrobiales bacterium]
MPINPDAAGYRSEPSVASWDSKDALLYALGVGAGVADPTGFELEFTTENSQNVDQRVLPTFPVVIAGGRGAYAGLGEFNPAMLVHGEQSVRLHAPLPVQGEVSAVTTITGVYDKG